MSFYYNKYNSIYYNSNDIKDNKNMGNCLFPNDPKGKNKSTIKSQYYYENNSSSADICGINNYCNNCYFNSGLQIMASCNELVNELYKIKYPRGIIIYLKDAIYTLLNKKIYDPEKFLNYFCQNNSDFIQGTQCCSQDFIRTLIRNVNSEFLTENDNSNIVYDNLQSCLQGNENIEYEKFIKLNNLYMESKIQSLFSGITKSYSLGKCKSCYNNIEKISFKFFIDINIYLDSISGECQFSDVLQSNFGIPDELTLECNHCRAENTIKSQTCFIKLPDILIFTIERNLENPDKVSIIPSKTINMGKYLDKYLKIDSAEYELFAINIRLGSTINFGHEICHVKRNQIWYEISDISGKKLGTEIPKKYYYDSSYGLFYRKIKK